MVESVPPGSKPGEDADAAAPPLAAGDRLDEDLTVVTHLVRHRRGDVYRVREGRSERLRIAKVTSGSPRDVARLHAEAERLGRFDHPCIVRVVRELERGVLVEDVEGEALSRRLRGRGRVSWREVARIGAELAFALDTVHAAGLVHCDVKPDNIVVGKDRYVLIDFDLARPPGVIAAGTGTPKFLSPEQARGDLVGPPTDVWGLGGVLFRAATGRVPFPEAGEQDGAGEARYPQVTGRPPAIGTLRADGADVATIIDAMLDPRPACRPVLAWIAHALADLRSS